MENDNKPDLGIMPQSQPQSQPQDRGDEGEETLTLNVQDQGGDLVR